jgi:hypothetical protein
LRTSPSSGAMEALVDRLTASVVGTSIGATASLTSWERRADVSMRVGAVMAMDITGGMMVMMTAGVITVVTGVLQLGEGSPAAVLELRTATARTSGVLGAPFMLGDHIGRGPGCLNQ